MSDQSVKTTSILTKKDLRKTWLTWISFSTCSNNWERMQNLIFTIAMAPVLKKLYPDDKEKFAKRLSSHMEFYNTQPTAGCIVTGIVTAMEEEKALGKDIPDEAISGIKSSMMGPLAGIGDSVMNSLVEIILMSIGMTLAFQGNVFGPILYLLTWIPFSLGLSWWLMNRGYHLGINSLSMMSDTIMGRLVEALTQIGLVVIGGLSATYVAVSTSLVIPGIEGADETVVQGILDGILPGILPLGLVIFCYYLMTKKKISAMMLILILFAAGTVLSLLGILG